MSAQDIFETISSQYFQLTNSEKKVADYVLAHRMDAQYMSISELAEECAVADATISRFCRRLGLGGYNTFKLELAKASMAAHSARRAGMEEGGRDGFEAMCRERMQESTAALEQTVKRLDPEALKRAADLLLQAGRVLCMGQGSSMVLAEEAWTLLSSISPKFALVPDSHQQMAALALMEEGDAALYFSYSGSTPGDPGRPGGGPRPEGKGDPDHPLSQVTRGPEGGCGPPVRLQRGAPPGRVGPRPVAQLFVLDPAVHRAVPAGSGAGGGVPGAHRRSHCTKACIETSPLPTAKPPEGGMDVKKPSCMRSFSKGAELLGLQHRRSPKEAVFPTASRGPGIEMPDLRFFRPRSSTKHDNITNWS